jgi:hypothetical protein
MKEDVGPTTEFPCRKKMIPNARITIPTPVMGIPALMDIIRRHRIKGKMS